MLHQGIIFVMDLKKGVDANLDSELLFIDHVVLRDYWITCFVCLKICKKLDALFDDNPTCRVPKCLRILLDSWDYPTVGRRFSSLCGPREWFCLYASAHPLLALHTAVTVSSSGNKVRPTPGKLLHPLRSDVGYNHITSHHLVKKIQSIQ